MATVCFDNAVTQHSLPSREVLQVGKFGPWSMKLSSNAHPTMPSLKHSTSGTRIGLLHMGSSLSMTECSVAQSSCAWTLLVFVDGPWWLFSDATKALLELSGIQGWCPLPPRHPQKWPALLAYRPYDVFFIVFSNFQKGLIWSSVRPKSKRQDSENPEKPDPCAAKLFAVGSAGALYGSVYNSKLQVSDGGCNVLLQVGCNATTQMFFFLNKRPPTTCYCWVSRVKRDFSICILLAGISKKIRDGETNSEV